MNTGPISRRQALLLGGIGALAVTSGVAGWFATTAASPGSSPAGSGGDELIDPPVLDSRDGRLQVELVAAPGARLAGRDTRALGFGGGSPGPTLRVQPGDVLAVRLTNHLDQPTNLHVHGLRVSPQGNGDNPFLRIDPGASFDYLFRIPDDHPPGTHWYHPHHHGTVADQLFGGLAGALLVGGGPDLPITADRLLLVRDTTLDDAGNVVAATPAERMRGREGALVLVNGMLEPTVTTRPGAAQRWRIINACTSRVLALRLEGHPLVQLAQDGTFLPAPVPRNQLLLSPGGRADVVVQPTGTGRFRLIADPYDRGAMGGMMGGPVGPPGPVVLATMISTGPAAATVPLPAALPAEPGAGPATRQRLVTLQMGMGGGMGGGMAFAIDGRGYDPDRDDQLVAAGTTEEWTVRNAGPLDHPFHLHVWPFTVTASSAGAPVSGVPQDVVLVPAGGWARLRIPFTTFTGRSVYHCHILDHEDAGMMATVHVQP